LPRLLRHFGATTLSFPYLLDAETRSVPCFA
jgi:hypothetical protein